MKKQYFSIALIFATVFFSCKTAKLSSGTAKDDGKITVTFVQINDVYEIAPMQGGKVGGVARVATLKKQELAKNPNTLMVWPEIF